MLGFDCNNQRIDRCVKRGAKMRYDDLNGNYEESCRDIRSPHTSVARRALSLAIVFKFGWAMGIYS